MKCTWLVHPYEWRSGTSDGLFLPIYPPRSMRVVLGFWWLLNFCISIWVFLTNVESMDYTHFYLSAFASLFDTVHCPFSPWELVQTSPVHPNPMIRYALSHINLLISSTKQPPYLTYHGISIAILRYIAMQLSTVPFIMKRFIIVILPCMIM